MTNRALGILGLGAIAAYLVYRAQQGRPVFEITAALPWLPERPSVARSDATTTPDVGIWLGDTLVRIGQSLKGPGNSNPYRNLSASPGTAENPVAPGPDSYLSPATPYGNALLENPQGVVISLADPNLAAFSFMGLSPSLMYGATIPGGVAINV